MVERETGWVGTTTGRTSDFAVPSDETKLLKSGDRLLAETTQSTNQNYTLCLAEGHLQDSSSDGEKETPREDLERVDQGVFLFKNGEFQFEYSAYRPSGGGVANNGNAAFKDALSTDNPNNQRGNRVIVLNSKGDKIIDEEFDENVMSIDIAPTGNYVAVSTPPSDDNSVYILSVESGDLVTWHEANCDLVSNVEFSSDSTISIYDSPSKTAAYDINIDGDIIKEQQESAERLNVDLDSAVKKIRLGSSSREITAGRLDFDKAYNAAPEAISKDQIQVVINALADGKLTDYDTSSPYSTPPESTTLVHMSKDHPEKLLPFAEQFVDLLKHSDQGPVVTAGAVLRHLFVEVPDSPETNNDGMNPYAQPVRELLEHESKLTRQEAMTALQGLNRAEGYGHEYPPSNEGEADDRGADTYLDTQIERLQESDDPDYLGSLLQDIYNNLDQENASDYCDILSHEILDLFEEHEPNFEYGDVSTYDYRDDKHYNRYYLIKRGLRVLETVTAHEPAQLYTEIDRFLYYSQVAGDRNTNVRAGALQVLHSLADENASEFYAHSPDSLGQIFVMLHNPVDARVESHSIAICQNCASIAPSEFDQALPTLLEKITDDRAFATVKTVTENVPNILLSNIESLNSHLVSDNRTKRERGIELYAALAKAGELNSSRLSELLDLYHEIPVSSRMPLLKVVAEAVKEGEGIPDSKAELFYTLSDDPDWQVREHVAEIAVHSDLNNRERIISNLEDDPIVNMQDVTTNIKEK
ncbi:hypothetical protein [Halococcus thailandensis]|uniref:hypothetical protein n=1 Tax=Halococcus thailandensis TaxID=335952 RepID=UPI000AF36CC1|nr:hypothetical protein [Halococcus thailandensis]